jgi:hypothetical protein
VAARSGVRRLMYFPDLGTKTQIDTGDHVRAIGWLSRSHPFSEGEVPPDFADRLRALCEKWSAGLEALWWPAAGGFHECELCGNYRASGNIGVPAGPFLFVAPQMIFHYVEVHRYVPPDAFVQAVLTCPAPGSAEYARAVASFREINHERYRRLFPDTDSES